MPTLTEDAQNRTRTKEGKPKLIDIPIFDIVIDRNVRERNDGDIEALKDSIKQVGLLQPISVYQKDDNYICLMGHRRLTAFLALYKENKEKYHSIPGIITNDSNIIVKQLIENIQREDLTGFELYNGLKELRGKGLSNKEIAAFLGKSVQYVKDSFSAISDVDSDSDYKEVLKSSAGATLGHFRETKGIKDKAEKLEVLSGMATGKLTRKDVRERNKAPKKEKIDLTYPKEELKFLIDKAKKLTDIQLKLIINDLCSVIQKGNNLGNNTMITHVFQQLIVFSYLSTDTNKRNSFRKDINKLIKGFAK